MRLSIPKAPTHGSNTLRPSSSGLGARRLWIGLTAGLSLLVTAIPSSAQDPSGMDRAAVIASICELIETRYVDPEIGSEGVATIQANLEDGFYADVADPADLAGVLTEQLSEFDRHFHVFWRPPGSGPAPGSHSGTETDWTEISRLQNHGFEQIRRLPGNIGYLDLRFFDSVADGGSTAVAAMGFLAQADALIIDLQHNGGGEPAMVQLLMSYFFDAERVHYNSFYSRGSDSMEQYWTLARVEGRRMPEIPLYLLASRRTASAAEGFSYALQALKRATIVGQPTAGAAHPGETFPAYGGFSLFVSTGRPINPVTGSNWEKLGVQPDLEVSSTEALEIAQTLALERLLAAPGSEHAERERMWALEALHAARNPARLGTEQLSEFVGAYGNRTVHLSGEQLFYRRGSRREYPMLPLGDDRFLLQGKNGFRTRFERDPRGQIIRMIDMWSDGHSESKARN